MVSCMTAAHALGAPAFAAQPTANDDASTRPDLVATTIVRREPLWPGTDPVTCVELRDGHDHLIEVFDGSDGLSVLGEAIEHCRASGITVTSIVEIEPPKPLSHAQRARQREAAVAAWRAFHE